VRAAVATVMALTVALLWALAGVAHAHEVRPAYLQVEQRPDGRLNVLFKQPSAGQLGVKLDPKISGGLLDKAPSSVSAAPNFQIKTWEGVDAGKQGLQGRTVSIAGLERTITDALLVVKLANGDQIQQVLHPASPSMVVSSTHSGMAVPAYLTLGINHILTGFDHLMFVFGLLLLVGDLKTQLKTITAFTVAHSITMAATALGVLHVTPSLVEAMVALSIVFVAVELAHARQGKTGLTIRYPWLIAFTFGLLHGAAFAGALAEIGLPKDAIPMSLFLFNAGVEIGQLMFVAAVLAIGWLLARLPRPLPAWSHAIPAYAIGSAASFWFIERLHVAFT
jgi:hydrogenase/urease accessory protein HupE